MEDESDERMIEENNTTRLRWILNKGFGLGKKVAITGVVISSAPIILPPLVVISALSFALSVPFGFVYASYACSQKLMSKLLPSPMDSSEEASADFKGEYVLEEEEKEQMEDLRKGVETRIEFDDLASGEFGVDDSYNEVDYCDNVVDDYENALEVKEDNQEEEESDEILAGEEGNDDVAVVEVTHVVVIEESDEVRCDEEDGEVLRGSAGLLEKIRDGGEIDNGVKEDKAIGDKDAFLENLDDKDAFLENLDDEETVKGFEEAYVEKEANRVGGGEIVTRRVSEEQLDDKDVFLENLDNKDAFLKNLDDEETVKGFEEENVEKEANTVGGGEIETRRVSEEPLDDKDVFLENLDDKDAFLKNLDDEETVKGFEEENVEKEANTAGGGEIETRRLSEEPLDDKDVFLENLVEKEMVKGIQEENVGIEEKDKNVSEENGREDETTLNVEKRDINEVGKDQESEKIVEDKNVKLEKNNREVKETGDSKSEQKKLDGKVKKRRDRKRGKASLDEKKVNDGNEDTRVVNGESVEGKKSEYKYNVEGLNAEEKEIAIHEIDNAREATEEKGSDVGDVTGAKGVPYSEKSPENDNGKDNKTEETADGLGLPISKGVEHENTETAPQSDSPTPSNQVSLSEEKLWQQIDALRVIVGYKATHDKALIGELKALYIFTGVEPPPSFKDPRDLVEVNEKLRFLMSVVGVK